MGHIADRGARVGELARTLFLTLAGQILLCHRDANEAPSKPRRWWGSRRPVAAAIVAGPMPVVVSATFG
ncbi:MAG TPA: hypothetical protein VMA72_29420 [Streptosporangiaceae bacterium]|nr:hypothetical protein [Streptosporangiaceae bacterium]